MTEVRLNLTPDEAAVLLRLVGSALGETRVEVHRTHHNPQFRQEVLEEEDLLRGLLAKLQGPG